MKRWLIAAILWFLAFVLTVVLAVFQRLTGPTHPLRGSAEIGGIEVAYKLLRSHPGDGGLVIEIPDFGGEADVLWRRYPTKEAFERLGMTSTEGVLRAELPHFPAAGKVEYLVEAVSGSTVVQLPPGDTVVARYRGDVPASVLIPHILAMFLSMLMATRALLQVMRPGVDTAPALVLISMGLLIAGGLCLGPMVQKFAFGAYWTGWPNGTDLTDNKTLVAFLAWLPATVLALRGARQRFAVVLGWIVMMGIFLIPHSMRGSEIDWEQHSEGAAADAAHAPPS